MEEKNLRETDVPAETDAVQASETAETVDTTPAEPAAAVQDDAQQAVALREDKSPEAEDDLEDEDTDEEEDDEEDAEDAAEEQAETPPPYCDKVFGMHRLALYGICFGYGGGLLLTGLFGLVTGIEVTTSSIPGIAGAVIGYFIGQYATKRLLAKAKAEAEAAQAANDSTIGQA